MDSCKIAFEECRASGVVYVHVTAPVAARAVAFRAAGCVALRIDASSLVRVDDLGFCARIGGATVSIAWENVFAVNGMSDRAAVHVTWWGDEDGAEARVWELISKASAHDGVDLYLQYAKRAECRAASAPFGQRNHWLDVADQHRRTATFYRDLVDGGTREQCA